MYRIHVYICNNVHNYFIVETNGKYEPYVTYRFPPAVSFNIFMYLCIPIYFLITCIYRRQIERTFSKFLYNMYLAFRFHSSVHSRSRLCYLTMWTWSLYYCCTVLGRYQSYIHKQKSNKYCIAQNVGGGKYWRIWRLSIDSPKFSHPNIVNTLKCNGKPTQFAKVLPSNYTSKVISPKFHPANILRCTINWW